MSMDGPPVMEHRDTGEKEVERDGHKPREAHAHKAASNIDDKVSKPKKVYVGSIMRRPW